MPNAAYLAFEPEDAAMAEAVSAELERQGWDVRGSNAETRNNDLIARLSETVAEARVVVAFLSPAAEQSPWMRRELSAAFSNGRALVPVLAAELGADSWLRSACDVSRAIDLRDGVGVEELMAIAERARSATGRGRVITMLNIKGGVGKTILAANLFAAAHVIDKRTVSFIDLDPQHNLSQYFLAPAERNTIRTEGATIYSVLMGNGRAVADFDDIPVQLNRGPRKAKRPRFELVAGDERLFEFTLDTRSEREKTEAFTRFRALVALLRSRSDAVIIDSNPCATFLTRLAITAADHIVAPVRPEKYSLTGLNMLEHVVREVRGRPLRPSEFSVLLNGVNDRTRSDAGTDADALTRAEISAAPFYGAALLAEAVPYAGSLKAPPSDRYAANPINVTAITRVGSRAVKESLARSAAAILRRASE
jgi:chromosome partitioning protein